MKRYLPLAILSLILFLAAGIFCGILVVDTLTIEVPGEDAEIDESLGYGLGYGLSLAITLVFTIIGGAVQLVSAILALIGFLLTRRPPSPRGIHIYYGVMMVLPLLLTALYLLLLL